MKTLNKSRKFLTVLGVLLILQGFALTLLGSDLALTFAVFFVEAVLLVFVLWIDARNLSRHSQLLNRIARASTRPEVNQLKWQLAERDQHIFDTLLTESRSGTKAQHRMSKELVELASAVDSLQSASKQIRTNHRSLRDIQSELAALPRVQNEFRALHQQVHKMETAPKLNRANSSIERLRQDQRNIQSEIEHLKTLMNEMLVAVDAAKFNGRPNSEV